MLFRPGRRDPSASGTETIFRSLQRTIVLAPPGMSRRPRLDTCGTVSITRDLIRSGIWTRRTVTMPSPGHWSSPLPGLCGGGARGAFSWAPGSRTVPSPICPATLRARDAPGGDRLRGGRHRPTPHAAPRRALLPEPFHLLRRGRRPHVPLRGRLSFRHDLLHR
jgi:hypothetical protein